MKDLVCLAADKNIEAALRGLLARPQALGVRDVDCDVFVHPGHDPACYHKAEEFLRAHTSSYAHALVLFDRAWEGGGEHSAERMEADVRARLPGKEWAEVVVIDPELEVWVWSDSPHVEGCLGWAGRDPALRAWLAAQGLWPHDAAKPPDPKLAVERALYVARKPRSSAIYRELARSVSVERCADASFARLRACLRRWFAAA